MTLIDAINKKIKIEKNSPNKDCLIISRIYNISLVYPIYDVVRKEIVIIGFYDNNLSFHKIEREMLNITDWEIKIVYKTILNRVTRDNNIIYINGGIFHFSALSIEHILLSKR